MAAANSRIKELRKLRNLTQEQLAERCDISVSTLSRWESGSLRPNSRHQQMLAGILDVDENLLFVFPERPMPSSLLINEIMREAEALTVEEQRYILDIVRGLRALKHPD